MAKPFPHEKIIRGNTCEVLSIPPGFLIFHVPGLKPPPLGGQL
jgi:hypothetical protein